MHGFMSLFWLVLFTSSSMSKMISEMSFEITDSQLDFVVLDSSDREGCMQRFTPPRLTPDDVSKLLELKTSKICGKRAASCSPVKYPVKSEVYSDDDDDDEPKTMVEMWYKRFMSFAAAPSNRLYVHDDERNETKFKSDDTGKSMLEILIPAYKPDKSSGAMDSQDCTYVHDSNETQDFSV